MQWKTQAGNFITIEKSDIDFFLPKLSGTKSVRCKCHVDESTERRYDIILDIYLMDLKLYIKFSKNFIKG